MIRGWDFMLKAKRSLSKPLGKTQNNKEEAGHLGRLEENRGSRRLLTHLSYFTSSLGANLG